MSTKAIKSAMLIQRWFRRYKSRIEIKKMTAWHIYQSIEYSGEQDHLKLFEFFLTFENFYFFIVVEVLELGLLSQKKRVSLRLYDRLSNILQGIQIESNFQDYKVKNLIYSFKV